MVAKGRANRRVGQARFERRPTIFNHFVCWWAGASKRRWSHPTSIFQRAVILDVAANETLGTRDCP